MASPYRHHPRLRDRSLALRLHPEVWGSAMATMAITCVVGLSLCATADEMLGVASGSVLLAASVALAPFLVLTTRRRPERLEVSSCGIRLVYPDGRDRRIAYEDLFIHRVSRGRLALDAEAKMLVYVDELTSDVRGEIVALLSDLAGYDVLAPETEILHLASRREANLRFRANLDVRGIRRLVFVGLSGFGVFAFLTQTGWWAFGIVSLAGALLVALESLSSSTVVIDGGVVSLRGTGWPKVDLRLDALEVTPTSLPDGLVLDDQVRLYRILFTPRDWETLVALLSRALGYDVSEPAAEAARLAKLSRRAS